MDSNLQYIVNVGGKDNYGFPQFTTCICQSPKKRLDFRRYLKKGSPNKVERLFLSKVIF